MQPEALKIEVADGVEVSALWQSPGRASACLALAHGAGAGMTHRSMSAITDGLETLVKAHGYETVFALVALESAGLPMPAEAALVSAAIYAGRTQQLSLAGVIAAAAAGAILGDNLGFFVGRRYGAGLLLRHGARIGLDEGRLKIGQYLFARFGLAVIVIGRFTALLRASAALLAGVNRFPWSRFLVANALGGIAWASITGLAAASFGRSLHRLTGTYALGGIALLLVVLGVAVLLFRRNEARLRAAAERAFPGPLKPLR